MVFFVDKSKYIMVPDQVASQVEIHCKQKVVIKLSMENRQQRIKALKTAVGVHGVKSVSLDIDKVVVMGNGIDAIALTWGLRRKLGYADLISVTPSNDIKEEKKEDESEADIIASINSIPMLNDSNFKEWKENLLILLGVMDLDLALENDCPIVTNNSTCEEKKEREKWDKSNRMCLIIMKNVIPEAFMGSISDNTTMAKVFLEDIENRFVKNDKVEIGTDNTTMAKEFLVDIENRFVKNDKVEIGTLLTKLISYKYKDQGNISEYIMEMSHLASKLRALKLEISEDLLVHLILISLPTQFNQFKMSYNFQKETWSLNELISHCIHEEHRLKQDKTESAHIASTSNNEGTEKPKKDKEVANTAPQKIPDKKNDKQKLESEVLL